MTKTILVIGAGGFIGRETVKALAACGWARPVAAGRHFDDGEHSGIACRRVDARSQSSLRRALDGVDAVVNCMAGTPEAMDGVCGTLFEAARQAGRPAVVHMSSMAVYGGVTGAVDETAETGDAGGNAYARSKLAAERHAAAYPRAVVLRPGCVYGPGGRQWSGRIARLLQARRIGDLGAGGDGLANLVHVRDVAAAVVAALADPGCEGEVFNLAMAAPPTWNDYFLRFAKALGAVPIRRLSERRQAFECTVLAPPLKIAEIIGGRCGLADRSPPPIPPSLARLWRQDIRLVSAKAEKRLGLTWMPLAEGVADAAAWCGAKGWGQKKLRE